MLAAIQFVENSDEFCELPFADFVIHALKKISEKNRNKVDLLLKANDSTHILESLSEALIQTKASVLLKNGINLFSLTEEILDLNFPTAEEVRIIEFLIKLIRTEHLYAVSYLVDSKNVSLLQEYVSP